MDQDEEHKDEEIGPEYFEVELHSCTRFMGETMIIRSIFYIHKIEYSFHEINREEFDPHGYQPFAIIADVKVVGTRSIINYIETHFNVSIIPKDIVTEMFLEWYVEYMMRPMRELLLTHPNSTNDKQVTDRWNMSRRLFAKKIESGFINMDISTADIFAYWMIVTSPIIEPDINEWITLVEGHYLLVQLKDEYLNMDCSQRTLRKCRCYSC